MRKKTILATIICCALAALSLASCKNDAVEKGVETYDTIYEEHDVSDRDDDGNLILTSTDHRQVYLIDSGTYLVVVFSDSGPSSITVVKDFGTSDAAVEYMTSKGQELLGSGEYSNLRLDGKYVTYSPTFSSEKYGQYYTMSKSGAEKALSAYVKQ